MRFQAFTNQPLERPLVVVDLGYSNSSSSCGVTWTGRTAARNHRFGVAVENVVRVLANFQLNDPVLVLEGPLSGRHNARGNPTRRGEFERGREWYRQPAACVCLGALRFLQELSERLPEIERIWIAEAFLSNKPPGGSPHHSDADRILNDFWSIEPAVIDDNTQPLSPLVDGVPSVRIFRFPVNA